MNSNAISQFLEPQLLALNHEYGNNILNILPQVGSESPVPKNYLNRATIVRATLLPNWALVVGDGPEDFAAKENKVNSSL